MVQWENETFSSHTYTELADLDPKRTWGESELKCLVGKRQFLDLKMQLVEGPGHFLQSKEQ